MDLGAVRSGRFRDPVYSRLCCFRETTCFFLVGPPPPPTAPLAILELRHPQKKGRGDIAAPYDGDRSQDGHRPGYSISTNDGQTTVSVDELLFLSIFAPTTFSSIFLRYYAYSIDLALWQETRFQEREKKTLLVTYWYFKAGALLLDGPLVFYSNGCFSGLRELTRSKSCGRRRRRRVFSGQTGNGLRSQGCTMDCTIICRCIGVAVEEGNEEIPSQCLLTSPYPLHT